MPSGLDSPVDSNASKDISTTNSDSKRHVRTRPRLTGYRIIFFLLTCGFGTVKGVLSYLGNSTVPTFLDWAYGVVVVSLWVLLTIIDGLQIDSSSCFCFGEDYTGSHSTKMNALGTCLLGCLKPISLIAWMVLPRLYIYWYVLFSDAVSIQTHELYGHNLKR